MEKTDIGLNDKTLNGVSSILNKILADEYILYTKTRNFHWNVTGPHFNDLHKFFESQYEQINESIDEIAERIRMLGIFPKASLKDFLSLGIIKEQTQIIKSDMMVKELLADHELMIGNIRESIEKVEELGDAGNGDFLVALMQQHEKMAWMLRSMI